MEINTVLLDLTGNSAPADKPLMLHSVLFCPVLNWVCRELLSCGAQRFFIVCNASWQEEARHALPDGLAVTFYDTASDALRDCSGEVLVIPSAVLPVMAFGESPIYTADADVLRQMQENGVALSVRPAQGQEAMFWLPIHSAVELNRAMPLCRDALLSRHIENGVTIIDPMTTYIDPRVTVAAGTTILPGTILRGNTSIAAGCEIGPNAMIRDSAIGEGTTVNASQVNESTVGKNTTVGPFTYVRPNCTIGDGCRVGDFVEVKNSVIGNGTKISHLTYVGDSDVGEKVNFGCGTVTTNYDGNKKYRCTIGDNVFLGCNTNLIAPVSVGDGAYTAAGSTVTVDVPADALAIARSKQLNKNGWAARFRKTWKK
ncbi:MAG: glucosamine-1-phosphate N-acetyltransferase [Clostridiales bacterium]|nr:glucosamine-1-phosphate N-acetyltransferase [Candidatus Cacconaster stercorequi]